MELSLKYPVLLPTFVSAAPITFAMVLTPHLTAFRTVSNDFFTAPHTILTSRSNGARRYRLHGSLLHRARPSKYENGNGPEYLLDACEEFPIAVSVGVGKLISCTVTYYYYFFFGFQHLLHSTLNSAEIAKAKRWKETSSTARLRVGVGLSCNAGPGVIPASADKPETFADFQCFQLF